MLVHCNQNPIKLYKPCKPNHKYASKQTMLINCAILSNNKFQKLSLYEKFLGNISEPMLVLMHSRGTSDISNSQTQRTPSPDKQKCKYLRCDTFCTKTWGTHQMKEKDGYKMWSDSSFPLYDLIDAVGCPLNRQTLIGLENPVFIFIISNINKFASLL